MLYTYNHFSTEAFRGYLRGFEYLNLGVVEKKPSIFKCTNSIASFFNETIIVSTICCSCVYCDSH